jgi:hypothetical protein
MDIRIQQVDPKGVRIRLAQPCRLAGAKGELKRK